MLILTFEENLYFLIVFSGRNMVFQNAISVFMNVRRNCNETYQLLVPPHKCFSKLLQFPQFQREVEEIAQLLIVKLLNNYFVIRRLKVVVFKTILD